MSIPTQLSVPLQAVGGWNSNAVLGPLFGTISYLLPAGRIADTAAQPSIVFRSDKRRSGKAYLIVVSPQAWQSR